MGGSISERRVRYIPVLTGSPSFIVPVAEQSKKSSTPWDTGYAPESDCHQGRTKQGAVSKNQILFFCVGLGSLPAGQNKCFILVKLKDAEKML